MKKYSFLLLLIMAAGGAIAQNGRSIAAFPQFKQYINPALTGHDGTSVQGFYRNQHNSFENAPQTFFLSGEANLSELNGTANTGKLNHSVGLAAIYDAFGSATTTGLNLSYAASAKITNTLNLRAGLAVTYDKVKTETTDLHPLDPNDPALKADNMLNKYGLNAGVALTSEDFYVGYAAYDAVKSGSGNQGYYEDNYILQHAVQAGYRYALTNGFGLVANALCRYDEQRKAIAEGHLKTVFNNTFWVGGGYRQDAGTILNAGVRIQQLKLGYSRELNTHRVNGERMGANEIVLSYHFSPALKKAGKGLSIW